MCKKVAQDELYFGCTCIQWSLQNDFERMQYDRNKYKFPGHLHGLSGQFDMCLYEDK